MNSDRNLRVQLDLRPELAQNPFAIILGLLETRIDDVADVLERVYSEMDEFSRRGIASYWFFKHKGWL